MSKSIPWRQKENDYNVKTFWSPLAHKSKTKAYKIYCDIIDTKFVIARLDHPLIARAVQILNAIALGLYISVNSPTTT